MHRSPTHLEGRVLSSRARLLKSQGHPVRAGRDSRIALGSSCGTASRRSAQGRRASASVGIDLRACGPGGTQAAAPGSPVAKREQRCRGNGERRRSTTDDSNRGTAAATTTMAALTALTALTTLTCTVPNEGSRKPCVSVSLPYATLPTDLTLI